MTKIRIISDLEDCKRTRELLLDRIPGATMGEPTKGRKPGREGEQEWLCYGVVETPESDLDRGGGS